MMLRALIAALVSTGATVAEPPDPPRPATMAPSAANNPLQQEMTAAVDG